MPRFARAAVLLLFAAGLATAGSAATYDINKPHTYATFRIRHWVSNVEGRFDGLSGTIQFDPKNPAASSVAFTVDAKTVDTNNERRDSDLRSANFFDVDRCPVLAFKSSAVSVRDASHYDVTGELTMRCVTRQVTVPVEFLGLQQLSGGSEKAGFESTFTIDRKDYGIVWNQTLDNGSVMLGDDVKITISVEADRRKEPAQ